MGVLEHGTLLTPSDLSLCPAPPSLWQTQRTFSLCPAHPGAQQRVLAALPFPCPPSPWLCCQPPPCVAWVFTVGAPVPVRPHAIGGRKISSSYCLFLLSSLYSTNIYSPHATHRNWYPPSVSIRLPVSFSLSLTPFLPLSFSFPLFLS